MVFNLTLKTEMEILSEIILPPADDWRSVYLKLHRRNSFDFPILGVAAALRFADDGTVADATNYVGSRRFLSREATEAANRLVGQKLTPEIINEVAILAAKRAKPLNNADLTINYRKQVTPVYIRRALAALAELH